MKRKIYFPVLIILLVIFRGCKIDGVPGVTTIGVGEITETSAKCVADIVSDGGMPITACGICWSTNANPTIELNTRTIESNVVGKFTSVLTGLEAGTLYYIRAFAINPAGTAYGNQLSFTTISEDTGIVPNTVFDIDGNIYPVMTIGPQTWMAGNLKTTRYNDGTLIPHVINPGEWISLSAPAYCWYKNDSTSYKAGYGALYNWHAVNTGKLCPSGWHVPVYAEWIYLITYLGKSPAGIGGFQPGGQRLTNGSFFDIGEYGYWWSATEYFGDYAWGLSGTPGLKSNSRFTTYKYCGFSVVCLKD